MGWDGVIVVEYVEVLCLFDDVRGFVDFAVCTGYAGYVECEVFGHEGVHAEALVDAVAVAFVGDVVVLDVFFGAVEFIYGFDVGVFDFGCVLGPVAAAAYQQQGAGGGECGAREVPWTRRFRRMEPEPLPLAESLRPARLAPMEDRG